MDQDDLLSEDLDIRDKDYYYHPPEQEKRHRQYVLIISLFLIFLMIVGYVLF